MVKKLTRIVIPADAATKYPVRPMVTKNLPTNSWFKAVGESTQSVTVDTDKNVLRCEKVTLHPNDQQKQILAEWFNLCRYAYNSAVKEIKTNGMRSWMTLRRIVKQQFPLDINRRMSVCGVPEHTIDQSIKDAHNAFKTSFALHKGRKCFRIRYKKAKAHMTINLEPQDFSKVKNQITKKLGVIKSSESLIGITHACKLKSNYILFVPKDVAVKQSTTVFDCCSLDPGQRTFQTVYCSDGTNYKIGTNNDVITKLDRRLQLGGKSKFKRRIRDRISHLIEDLHWKTIALLRPIAAKILIGNMSTIGVLSGRNLNAEVKRNLQALSHYTFRMRLLGKCEEYGINLVVADESYTSKTCGGCNKINENLGATKIFKCDCGFTCDRDLNGARNIMIKNLN